ncbi:imidazole glycerol phosphate synthase subunit HisH [Bifidobacterium sp. 82T24]|uniref:imidazole glycerol phosphate synthase subunit HisH n=1 Tax=Bifidobacterium pluvialisilvae TaxID=2834436 RepID=UPI001C56567B|nr:imidazole glycerol phosphate synthase subunit HisH [Bifidobacterium pluvialisilvae]MBW3087753.1 imidazole glycerol phosphate synthase subunit HisH [Bifidobacterium pluvialisilvae]
MTSVVVFDYGFGNVRSMVRALANLDVDVTLTSDYRQSMDADGLVVPGVGAFAACVKGLRTVGGDRVIAERLQAGKPVLGVCVGLQVMFSQGVEGGTPADGLGYFGGVVEPLDADVVPHMGWNTIEAAEGSRLLKGLGNERFYFVHSYAVSHPTDDGANGGVLAGDDERITWCEYGRSRFVAAVEQGPLSATQFHPEKSAEAGAQLLRNWIATF